MFRWLKDRSKKNRKSSVSPTASLLSKEDDYGFKRKLQQQQQQEQQQQQQQQSGEYKRDLPPTPADLMSSCNLTDDDKSLHIYEEIPDLPFRCTPEGELRIHLAKEELNRKQRPLAAAPSDPWQTLRDVSPYMVVPLERLPQTPNEFRATPHAGFPPPSSSARPDKAFAGALVGEKRGEGEVTPCPSCDSPSQGTSSPSCCGSSVFGSPLLCGGEGRGGGLDMSDRLLTAINLTRLLAAVRLSSSSADTCTTSPPLCIGVDRDGRNISVSVTPTTPLPLHTTTTNTTNTTTNNSNSQQSRGEGEEPSGTQSPPPPPHPPHPSLLSSLHKAESGSSKAAVGEATQSSQAESVSSPTEGGLTGQETQSDTDCQPPSSGEGGSGGGAELASSRSSESGEEEKKKKPHIHGYSSSERRLSPASLRLVPSPTEHSAITEILQLRPGESTELDPATIDALLLRLCSSALEPQAALEGPQGAVLHPQELEAVENVLRQMLRSGEEEEESLDPSSSSPAHPSPNVRRAENSDTGVEYDVSTSSESEQASYDYFLSKAARTRSLECEVKKLIDGGEEEEDGGEGGSVATLSTISPTTTSLSPSTPDSDDGTMADLSESENSSGYYESAAAAQQQQQQQAGGGRVGMVSEGGRRDSGGRRKKKGGGGDGGRTQQTTGGRGEQNLEVCKEVDLPCYELQGTEVAGSLSGHDLSPTEPSSLGSRSSLYSHLSPTPTSSDCVSRATPLPHHHHPKSKEGGKKSRHHHHHHHHHHRERKGGGEHRSKPGKAKDSNSSPARGFPSRDLLHASPRDSDPSTAGDLGKGMAATGGVYNSSKSLYGHALPGGGTKTRKRDGKDREGGRKSKPSSHHPADYPYYSLLYSPGPTPHSPHSRAARQRPLKAPKTSLDLSRSASFHSAHPLPDTPPLYSEASRQASEVYSIPAALPEPPGGPGGRSLAGVGGRGVQESSEVYGTRAGFGVQGGGVCHNRLLSDLIMLNYNRQVLHM